ncbi:type II secretion system protein GspM [Proteinivorax tanatarense]|uniref:Type II secretion system protein GspM n=1 Tax=Proteinivorax tanatarense TaxID=1260629 RepID=A0AAU7VNZ5_9FIRM
MNKFLSNMTEREKTMLIILALLIALYGFYSFVIESQIVRLNEIEDKIVDTEQQIQEIDIYLQTHETWKKRYDPETIEKLNNSIPPTLQKPQIIVWLEENVDDTSLSFNIDQDELASLQVQVSFTGTYQQVKQFLNELYENQRFVDVSNLNVRQHEEAWRVEMMLTYYGQNHYPNKNSGDN